MKPGSDPVDYFATMDELRLRLKDFGEELIDDRYADVLLRSLPKEYNFITQIKHRDRSFSLEDNKRTAINFHIDELSRKSSHPPIAGRGAALAAASGSDQCHHCQGYGHFRKDCPKFVQKEAAHEVDEEEGPETWRRQWFFAKVVFVPQNRQPRRLRLSQAEGAQAGGA